MKGHALARHRKSFVAPKSQGQELDHFLYRNPVFGTSASNADPVQMPENAPSDQGKHCLPSGIPVQNL